MKAAFFIAGAVGGATLMYLLDPQMGNRRRALIRDQFVHAGHEAEDATDRVSRELRNRAQGVQATMQRPDGPVSDAVLVQRVRSEIGHHIRHAGAVEVRARDGHIILGGPVLQSELDSLLGAVRKVPGVKTVENRMMVHEHAGNIPDLQTGDQVGH